MGTGQDPGTHSAVTDLSQIVLVSNQAIGLLGGNDMGSGVFNGRPTPSASPSLKMEAGRVVDNGATGGVAATGGNAGQGIGSGIYVTTAGVAHADMLTAIDDVFATFARR